MYTQVYTLLYKRRTELALADEVDAVVEAGPIRVVPARGLLHRLLQPYQHVHYLLSLSLSCTDYYNIDLYAESFTSECSRYHARRRRRSSWLLLLLLLERGSSADNNKREARVCHPPWYIDRDAKGGIRGEGCYIPAPAASFFIVVYHLYTFDAYNRRLLAGNNTYWFARRCPQRPRRVRRGSGNSARRSS